MKEYKNRNREYPSFANINFQGPCNLYCYFCLGNELSLDRKNNFLNVDYKNWKNLDKYLEICESAGISKIYLTGQNTDPLLYQYLESLVNYLHSKNFQVGIRTNGVMALEKLKEINKCDSVSFSIHALDQNNLKKITGYQYEIDWKNILNEIKIHKRISIVINRYNKDEIFDMIKYFSNFSDISYLQLRCIATDYNYDYFKEDIEDFNDICKIIDNNYPLIEEFYSAKIYDIYGMNTSLWKTVQTTINSYNYFTDGIISDDYFIVEGYQKRRGLK